MLIKVKNLIGYNLKGLDGEIGNVKEFYFDDHHWTIRYLVAETGNWLTERVVLISPYSLVSVSEESKNISINLTKKQIEDSPPLDSDKPVSKQFEQEYYSYYGWPTYWIGSYAWGLNPYIVRDPYKLKDFIPKEHNWDLNLRSTNNVTSYHIKAIDGEIGHVDDFIIDDETWTIHYLVINTHNWLPGKIVLISPQWIKHISWNESTVYINQSREVVKYSPECPNNYTLNRDYEDRLHKHYNYKGYWEK